VVVPVSPRGSGDGRVRLLAAHADSEYFHRLAGPHALGPAPSGTAPAGPAGAVGQPDVLAADDPLAQQAFAAQ